MSKTQTKTPRTVLLAMLTAGILSMQPLAAQEPAESNDERNTEETAEREREIERLTVVGALSRYSALKSDTPIMETARSVSIETQRDIVDKGALELSDVYQFSAGVFGETYGFATRGDWVRVRGLNVPEYRDSLQALFGFYNNARPHVYSLEQVEILKGPASVLYGQGSPGGLVNVVTKRPRSDIRPEVVVQYGSYDHVQVATDFGGSLNESGSLAYRVTALNRDSDTMVDFVHNDTLLVAPSIMWSPSPMTHVTLLGSVQESRARTGAQFVPIKGVLEPAANGRFIEDSTFLGEPEFDRYNTDTDSVTLLADHVINTTWSLEVTGRWTEGGADYHQAWPSFIGGDRYVYNDNGTFYRDGMVPRTFYDSDAQSEQFAVDSRLRADFSTGALHHELMMGAQYQDVTTENDFAYAYALGYDFATGGPDETLGDRYWINLFDPAYGNVPPDELLNQFFTDGPEAHTRDRGLYLNDQISIGNWRITAGVRYDDVTTDTGTQSQDDDAFSFSVGALYTFDNGIAPYASYAESFEPVVGVDNLTGEPFDPQEGRQYEIGVKYQPQGFPGQVTVAAFDIEQSNLPSPDSLPGAPSQQEGVASVRGVEIESILQFGEFTVEANASRLNTENARGFRFDSVPRDQFSTWLGWRPTGMLSGLQAGAGARYVGESWDGYDDIRTPGQTLYDVMLGYETGPWQFRLNARNVTDKEYLATCLARIDCFFGERRTVVGTVGYRF
ncbi:TonB-dependent siderophore receptor [Wenzhouxiangella sp. XN201]|uniref:TonB-dependent siderophore receptor n=1 Tax=Wenzhouxiangella sp. XN201 TaxID=2710755 RepID=UPI0013CA2678|nr:TonB-dependent siderophore receptor [Wenzhouxiangella sp. XN201]NEZ04337.1 TonB-dependent siderophore receptor [Wenzhouxiangella sp. XN201]